MKKLFLLLVSLAGFAGFSQENETWRIGAQWGLHGNSSYLIGGATEANSRFQNNNAGSGALTIVGRFDFNKHWMLMSGLGFNSYGFEYALTENYSAVSNERKYSVLKNEFGSFEVPVIAHYKFNPNCKNGKWVIGLGFVQSVIGDGKMSGSYKDGEVNSSSPYLSSETTVNGGLYPSLRFSVAYEKVYKRGSILNLGLYFNGGLKEIATSTVTYHVDGQDYTHQYGNKGNFVGLKLSYFLKPFSTKI